MPANSACDSTGFRLDADAIRRGIGALPSLPSIAVELLQSIDDENADTDSLASKISRDQALVARMLRVANSSFYGLQGRVGSIQDAIVVLGLRSVRTLATAAAVTGSLKVDSHSGFNLRDFWRHSIAVALCARALARRLRSNDETAFAAGLLHDIGRLALAACFPKHMAAVHGHQQQADCDPLYAERAVLGIDHAEAGSLLTTYWKFPVTLCQAIARHHEPQGAVANSLTGIVHLANAIAHALDLAGNANEAIPRLDAVVWATACLTMTDFHDVFVEVEEQFEGVCDSLVG